MNYSLPRFIFVLFLYFVNGFHGWTINTENFISQDNDNYIFSLVHFLQKNSPFSEHLFIITDKTTPSDVANNAVKSSFQDNIGVTIIDYKDNIVEKFIRKERHYGKKLHNVLVATSWNVTIKVLQEVKNKSLESGNILWFLLTSKSTDENLSTLIRDGTQLVIIEGNLEQRSKLQIRSTYWDVNSTLSFAIVGWFSSTSTWLSFGNQLYHFPSNEVMYKNFNGRRIKVVVNNSIIYFLQRMDKKGNPLPWEGIDVNILNTVAAEHNFTYDLIHPKDGLWGGPEKNGTISGLVGVVSRHEAHLSIQELTITEERASVVDFTRPYYTEGSTIASKAPDLRNQAKAVVSPFSFQVWVLLIVTLFIVGIATKYLHIAAAISNNHDSSAEVRRIRKKYLFFHLFNTYNSLVLQDNKIRTKISSMRIILGSWFLICIVFNALYSGNLCAVFAAPSYDVPINSLQDLWKALKEGHIYPICSQGTSIEYLFREATTGVHHEIYKYFDPKKSFANYQERYSKTAEGKAVVMTSMTSNIIKTNTYGPGRDKFYIGNENFYGQSYGIALPKGSPWINTFSKTLQLIVEAGLVDLWIAENIAKQLIYIGVGKDKGNVLSRRTNDPKPVSITQLQAAYFILVVGLALSFLSLVTEIIYNKYFHLQLLIINNY